MKVFALADLHMDGKQGKPMDVFGEKWQDHVSRIEHEWREIVSEEDLVLVPGDTSWAKQLDDALPDIERISSFPGTKLISRGNHDYWWSSPTKMRSRFPENVKLIQNDSFVCGRIAFAGTRGWLFPSSAGYVQEDDEKIYNRELLRLEMTLTSAKRRIEQGEADSIMLMMHYPPIGEMGSSTGFTEVIAKYPEISDVVYGHLHAQSTLHAFEGEFEGKRYWLCSSDYLNFKPRLIRTIQ